MHPKKCLIATVSSQGHIYLWSKQHRSNMPTFTPDFIEIEDNIEYDEKEDEFDLHNQVEDFSSQAVSTISSSSGCINFNGSLLNESTSHPTRIELDLFSEPNDLLSKDSIQYPLFRSISCNTEPTNDMHSLDKEKPLIYLPLRSLGIE